MQVTLRSKLCVPETEIDSHRELMTTAARIRTPERNDELTELELHYSGTHAEVIARTIKFPPGWSPAAIEQARDIMLHVNSTRTALRTLVSGVYGGGAVREVCAGDYATEISDYAASAEYMDAAISLLAHGALYGTGYLVVNYTPGIGYELYAPDPVRTHILTAPGSARILGLAECDRARNWIRVWAPGFNATLSRTPEDTIYFTWSVPQDLLDMEGEVPLTAPIERPYLPFVIAHGEKIPQSNYGLSLLRDTPRFNHSLTTAYFNAAYTAKVKALALLTMTGADAHGEMVVDTMQLGTHSAIVLPSGAAAEFISTNADVASLIEVIGKLQELESYVLGIPITGSVNNTSAEAAGAVLQPLVSQVSMLARRAQLVERDVLALLVCERAWSDGISLNTTAARTESAITVRIEPNVRAESLQERTQSWLSLAKAGATTSQHVVAMFNPHLSSSAIEEQATVMDKRMEGEIATVSNKNPSVSDNAADTDAGSSNPTQAADN